MTMTWVKSWWMPWVFFVSLGALIVYPWFNEPGFLFLLDFVWSPELPKPLPPAQVGHFSSLPWQWLWWFLTQALDTTLVQKIAFSLPWLLAGLTMYHLTSWALTQYTDSPKRITTLAALGAGIFYLTNSFVFTRATMGQYYLLLAYAITPWALLAWFKFLKTTTVRTGFIAGLATTAVMLTNAHHLILMPLLLLFFMNWPQLAKWRAWLGFLTPLTVLAVTTLIFLPMASSGVTSLNPIGPWARALQAPHTGHIFLDALTLTATWKIDLPYEFPYESLSGFMLGMLILLSIMLAGILYHIRQRPITFLTPRLVILAAVSIGLAVGVAHPSIEPFAAWLYENIPGWLGFRDSAKFLSWLALSESMLLALGLTAIAQQYYQHRRAVLLATLTTILITLYLGSPTFFGLRKQISPSLYPSSWNALNEQLSTPDNKPRALWLPWHQYMPFDFTSDRTITNPAPDFFTNAEILSGDNSEVGGTANRPFIYSESNRPLSQRLETILADAPTRPDIGSRLAKERIKYVILITTTWDSDKYRYLWRQSDLELVFEEDGIVAWSNKLLP